MADSEGGVLRPPKSVLCLSQGWPPSEGMPSSLSASGPSTPAAGSPTAAPAAGIAAVSPSAALDEPDPSGGETGVHQPTTGPAVTDPSASSSGWQQPRRRQQQGRHQRPAVRQVYVPMGSRFSVLQKESAPATLGETAMEPPASTPQPFSIPSVPISTPPPSRPLSTASPSTRRSLDSDFLVSRAAQGSRATTRPPVTVRTSSMTAIPPGLVSFDYHMRGELFGYEFSRFFGA